MAAYTPDQISRYLAHIGYTHTGPGELPPPSLTTLTDILARQVARVPFENLSLHYSTADPPLSLDPQDLFRKIVDHGRGGYCMEVNTFFGAVLRGLGFSVLTVPGRVKKADGSGRFAGLCHVLNLVAVDGQDYQVEVSFGKGGPPVPVPLPPRRDGAGPHDFLRLPPASLGRLEWRHVPAQHTHPAQRVWVYSTRDGADAPWEERYSFLDVEAFPEDVEVLNYHTMMHPAGFCRRNVIAVRTVPEDEEGVGELPFRGSCRAKGTWVLFNSHVKRTVAGHEEVVEVLESEEQRVRALEKYFGIVLTTEQAAAIKGKPCEIIQS